MKQISYLLFFLLSFTNLSAQPEWNVQIPYEVTYPENAVTKMMKTQDDGFLILLKGSIDTIRYQMLYKYNDEGELLWEQKFDFGYGNPDLFPIPGPYPSDMIELDDGNVFVIGRMNPWSANEYAYGFLMSSTGDSLQLYSYPNYEWTSGLNYMNEQLYGMVKKVSDNDHLLLKISNEGLVEGNIDIDYSGLDYKVNLDGSIYTSIPVGSVSKKGYRKYSPSGELLFEQVYEYGNNQLIAQTADNILTTCGQSILQLESNNLEENWHNPLMDVFTAGSDEFSTYDIEPTADGGFIAVGTFFDYTPYAFKVDVNGNEVWAQPYSSNPDDVERYLPLRFLFEIEEVDDGYVVLGGENDNTFNAEPIWLVKLNDEGLLVSAEVPQSIDKTKAVNVYPNPVEDILYYDLGAPFEGVLQILTMQGQLVYQTSLDQSSDGRIDLSELVSGMYLLAFTDRDQTLQIVEKIIRL